LLSYGDIYSSRPGAFIESEQAVPGRILQCLFRSDLKPEPVVVESGRSPQVGNRDANSDKLRYRHPSVARYLKSPGLVPAHVPGSSWTIMSAQGSFPTVPERWPTRPCASGFEP